MTPLHRGELNDNTPVSDAGLAGIDLYAKMADCFHTRLPGEEKEPYHCS